MGIIQQYQIEDPSVSARWQERHGDDPNSPATHPYDEFIKQGLSSDEAFEKFISFLEKQGARVEKQSKTHPFQKRNYLVQAAMDDLMEFYKKHQGRKPGSL